MTPAFAIPAYCLLIVLGSYLGGWLPSFVRLTHTRMQLIVSFIGGLMLGVGLFHMLPHGAAKTGSLDQAIWWMVIGLLTMFFLIRLFHFHQHAAAETDVECDHMSPTDAASHEHSTEEGHQASHASNHHPLGWVGVAVGLAVHTLIDGIALGAGTVAEANHGHLFPGLGIFLVIVLHKPLDALSVTSLMAASGSTARMRQLVNIGFSLMCPLGAICFVLGIGSDRPVLIGCALAFSAGVFICISLGDLLPEVHFHTHDRFKLSAALLLGITAAYALGFLESHGHDSIPSPSGQRSESPQEHHGHEHHQHGDDATSPAE